MCSSHLSHNVCQYGTRDIVVVWSWYVLQCVYGVGAEGDSDASQRQLSPVQEMVGRMAHWQQRKAERIKESKQKQEEDELQEATFRPAINPKSSEMVNGRPQTHHGVFNVCNAPPHFSPSLMKVNMLAVESMV
jgi:hypothetical protein